jgi:hypothetical protein
MEHWTNPFSPPPPLPKRGSVPGGHTDNYEMGGFEEPPWETPDQRSSQRPLLKRYNFSNRNPASLSYMRSKTTAVWKIHWYMPTAMVCLLILGVFGAVSHHLFYSSLDGKVATNQLLKVRFGTAFAFFTKSMLVGTSVIAYRQRIWHTLREKAMTLNAIDSLFGVIEDPTMFGSWEMIRNAKLATLMALAAWYGINYPLNCLV